MTIYKEPTLYIDETLTQRVEHYAIYSKTDPAAQDLYKGHVTLMIEGYGAVPFDFPIPATSVESAFELFVESQQKEADRINEEQKQAEKGIIQMKNQKDIIT